MALSTGDGPIFNHLLNLNIFRWKTPDGTAKAGPEPAADALHAVLLPLVHFRRRRRPARLQKTCVLRRNLLRTPCFFGVAE